MINLYQPSRLKGTSYKRGLKASKNCRKEWNIVKCCLPSMAWLVTPEFIAIVKHKILPALLVLGMVRDSQVLTHPFPRMYW